jgi:hypothetical protein
VGGGRKQWLGNELSLPPPARQIGQRRQPYNRFYNPSQADAIKRGIRGRWYLFTCNFKVAESHGCQNATFYGILRICKGCGIALAPQQRRKSSLRCKGSRLRSLVGDLLSDRPS